MGVRLLAPEHNAFTKNSYAHPQISENAALELMEGICEEEIVDLKDNRPCLRRRWVRRTLRIKHGRAWRSCGRQQGPGRIDSIELPAETTRRRRLLKCEPISAQLELEKLFHGQEALLERHRGEILGEDTATQGGAEMIAIGQWTACTASGTCALAA
ncbi:hypothetical protein FA95DRAFT_693203 [Auriscalpium vulgare]|uniref:Uncharacterized protein n=1 Tax=Auriscalpium vulgare TaxID=40419 RepID=A0ACB8RBI6_9AGAM|nr:hypothetical protein FA95DRAFT_693203 [Auriscalpium vulgare]